MSDWFDYLADKAAKVPHRSAPIARHMNGLSPDRSPTRAVPNPRSCEGMLVEESAASDTAIQRIFRFWDRGGQRR
jgi:hypothetical protein